MSDPSPIRPIARPTPSSAFEAHDAEFEAVIGRAPRLARVVETNAHEGPVYAADEDALYFTSTPQPRDAPVPRTPEVAIQRVALQGERFPVDDGRVSVIRGDANAANGMAMDRDGSLVVCEQGTRTSRARIARLDRISGEVDTVVEEWRGLPLNSPNDIAVKSDGTLWFTDPTYGHLQGFKPEPLTGDYVYRYDPASDRLTVVEDSFNKPNGLAFSPDERILYITDSGANQEPGSFHATLPHHIMAFDVAQGRRLVNGRMFAVIAPGFPDGTKVDGAGRVYSSSFSGVQVFNPGADLIGEIHLPGAVNFAFGGRAGNILFITTDSAIWAAVLEATGS